MNNPKRIEKGMYWDRAWSLVGGCSKVSPGCENCWAEKEAHMRSSNPNDKVRDRYEGLTENGKFNGQTRLHIDNLDLPLRVKKPTVWAVWNDLFHEDIPFEFIGQVFGRMHSNRNHIFLVLTKRPERMAEFIDWYKREWIAGFEYAWTKEYPHVWLGVTAENQEQADKRIPLLLQTPAAVRFVSVEPMLGPVDLTSVRFNRSTSMNVLEGCGINLKSYTQSIPNTFCNKLDWVIAGCESGPGRRSAQEKWFSDLKNQCGDTNIPFFLKQMEINGKLVKMPELDNKEWSEFPEVQP